MHLYRLGELTNISLIRVPINESLMYILIGTNTSRQELPPN